MTFIVLEGLDGAGTTTQAQKLAESLRANGATVLLTKQPSDGPIGKMIRKMLSREIERPGPDGPVPIDRDTLALMYAGDRLDHIAREIQPALDRGEVVISDRYYASSFAYQGEDIAGEFSTEWVGVLNGRAITPDLTVFLEVPADICFERITARDTTRDIFENRAFLEKHEARYRQVIDELRSRGERIVTVDGTQSVESIHAQIVEVVS